MRDFAPLREFMDTTIPTIGTSGIDCIIYQDHEEIFRHSAGYSDMEQKRPMQPNSIYNMYSGSKMITCAAALQLLERGKLLLSTPVAEYLPEFRDMLIQYATFTIVPAKKPILISDLFSMTSGIGYNHSYPEVMKLQAETGKDFSTRDFAGAISREHLFFEPGEGWHYGFSHDILAAVVEVITGMTFGEYMKKNIFDPLGMKDACYTLPAEKLDRLNPQYQYNPATRSSERISSDCIGKFGARHESGGGGLIMPLEDYILFADAMACGGVGKSGARILSQRTIDLMRTNRLHGKLLEDYQRMVVAPGIGYGLGVAVLTDPAACGRLAPKGSFYWGGLGGVQNLIDPENRLAFFIAQHTVYSPKEYTNPHMTNILYACL